MQYTVQHHKVTSMAVASLVSSKRQKYRMSVLKKVFERLFDETEMDQNLLHPFRGVTQKSWTATSLTLPGKG